MEHVDSSAMKSLAAYADSDEDEGDISKPRYADEDSAVEDSDAERIDLVKRHRTLSNAEIAKAQLPEAPDSSGDDEQNEGGRVGAGADPRWTVDDDDIMGAKGRKSPLISDEFDEHSNDTQLVEPPPPPRPRMLHSPSPSSSRDSTPHIDKLPQLTSMPRLPSSQALVSYEAGEDEDESHHRRNMESAKEKREINTGTTFNDDIPQISEGSMGNYDTSRPDSDHSHKSVKSETTTDEIDVDELLERPLAVSANSAVDSPREVCTLESIQIPPAPAEKCSEELQAKFQQYLERKRRDGYNFNAVIQQRTDFRNPSIYEKLIEHFGIDEIGTNFPKATFNPHGFRPTDFYDEIAKAQRLLMEKGADKDSKPKSVTLGAAMEEKKRKSKWDN